MTKVHAWNQVWFQLGTVFGYKSLKSLYFSVQLWFSWHAGCYVLVMMRFLIAAYILVVLVLSAKAGANSEESQVSLNVFNYSSKAQ